MGASAVSSLAVEVGVSEGVPPEAAVHLSSPTKTRSSLQCSMICCWWSRRCWGLVSLHPQGVELFLHVFTLCRVLLMVTVALQGSHCLQKGHELKVVLLCL